MGEIQECGHSFESPQTSSFSTQAEQFFPQFNLSCSIYKDKILPSIHRFSAFVSSFALVNPKAEIINGMKPSKITFTQCRCATRPNFLRTVWRAERTTNAFRFPLAWPYETNIFIYSQPFWKYQQCFFFQVFDCAMSFSQPYVNIFPRKDRQDKRPAFNLRRVHFRRQICNISFECLHEIFSMPCAFSAMLSHVQGNNSTCESDHQLWQGCQKPWKT